MSRLEMDIQATFDWGVKIILWLQTLSPALDWPFKLLSFLGDEGFYLFLLPLIYWCIDRRTGARLTILFLASAYINSAAKVIAAQPRPFQYDPRVIPLMHAGGGGFPSGHAQHGVVVWGYLATRVRKIWSWAIAGFLIAAISLSRLYLGVHFPVDLLGGYILGALVLTASVMPGPPIEPLLLRQSLAVQVFLALFIPGVMVLLAPAGDGSCISAGAALMGIGAGMAMERRWVGFQTRGSWWKRLLRLLIGIAVSVAIWGGLKWAFSSLEPEPFYRFLRYGLLGFWAALGAPWIFLKLNLAEVNRPDPESRGSFEAE